MSRFPIWIVNGALFVLCCFLTSSLITGWVGEWLAGAPIAAPAAPAPAELAGRDWSQREGILTRNLFQVSTLLPEGPLVEELGNEDEELEATRLPLKLLGTVASSDPRASWAAIEDTTRRERQIVRAEDQLLDKATVVRIERRRIVLENAGKREELALDEEDASLARPMRTSARGRSAAPVADVSDLRERVQRLADDSFQVQREDVQDVMRNPAELFSQARILPKYEEGEMVGVQLNAIQPGSLFEDIGILDGDVITEVNGIVISSPQDSAALLRELTQSDQFDVEVLGADGAPRTLSYVIQP
jgi:general secretion pathway protein C